MLATLFKNPKVALAYVGFTLLSVVLFVGTEDDPGSLTQTVDTLGSGNNTARSGPEPRFGDQRPGQASAAPDFSQERGSATEFATDEDLVDGAEGFDPSPSEDFSGFDPNPNKLPYLSDQDKVSAQESDAGWAVPIEEPAERLHQ